MSGRTLSETRTTRIIEHDFAASEEESEQEEELGATGGAGYLAAEAAAAAEAEAEAQQHQAEQEGAGAGREQQPEQGGAGQVLRLPERDETQHAATANLQGRGGAHATAASGGASSSASGGGGITASVPGELAQQFHVLMTAGSGTYNTWQSRMHYYHYLKAKAMQEPGGAMGGFTRLLHRQEHILGAG